MHSAAGVSSSSTGDTILMLFWFYVYTVESAQCDHFGTETNWKHGPDDSNK